MNAIGKPIRLLQGSEGNNFQSFSACSVKLFADAQLSIPSEKDSSQSWRRASSNKAWRSHKLYMLKLNNGKVVFAQFGMAGKMSFLSQGNKVGDFAEILR